MSSVFRYFVEVNDGFSKCANIDWLFVQASQLQSAAVRRGGKITYLLGVTLGKCIEHVARGEWLEISEKQAQARLVIENYQESCKTSLRDKPVTDMDVW